MNPNAEDNQPHWWVICLCAEWCGVCREWRDAFNAQAASHPELHFAWVDIEDEADAMGDVDIETFPTLMIARENTPMFFGPVLPSGSQFARLLESLREQGVPAAAVSVEAAPLLQRLSASVLPNR